MVVDVGRVVVANLRLDNEQQALVLVAAAVVADPWKTEWDTVLEEEVVVLACKHRGQFLASLERTAAQQAVSVLWVDVHHHLVVGGGF